jgi:hypothetical protein
VVVGVRDGNEEQHERKMRFNQKEHGQADSEALGGLTSGWAGANGAWFMHRRWKNYKADDELWYGSATKQT